MTIEEEIFRRCSLDFDKLLAYGFILEDDHYIYEKNIMDDSFKMVVIVSFNHKVEGKLYDLAFDVEYTNFRISSYTGEYVAKVRGEFEAVLQDIKNNCSVHQYYSSIQANRISDLITDKYHTVPEFPWEKTPDAGIYRHVHNKKWFGLIMYININKIGQGDEMVNIINVKLREDTILQLLERDGFYKAYHMNKKSWITIVLNDTLSDEEIMMYIEESHRLTA